jgi:hypothetical protein
MASHYHLVSGAFAGNCSPGAAPPPGCGYTIIDPDPGTPSPWFDGDSWHPGNPPPEQPVAALSMAGFRLALHRLGFLSRIENYMDEAPIEHRILWEYSTEVHRSDPVLAELATALGFSSSDLDAVFK